MRIKKPSNEDKQYFYGQANSLSSLIGELESINDLNHLRQYIFNKKKEFKLLNFAITCEEYVFKDGFFCLQETIENQQNKKRQFKEVTKEQGDIILNMWQQRFSTAQCARFVNLEQKVIKTFLVKKGLLA